MKRIVSLTLTVALVLVMVGVSIAQLDFIKKFTPTFTVEFTAPPDADVASVELFAQRPDGTEQTFLQAVAVAPSEFKRVQVDMPSSGQWVIVAVAVDNCQPEGNRSDEVESSNGAEWDNVPPAGCTGLRIVE